MGEVFETMEFRIRLGCQDRIDDDAGPRRQGVSGSIMLVSAVFGSLAAGVLAAYGVCQAMFALFRIHARTLTTGKPVVKATPQIAQG
jgi:hypothetical protein